VHDGSFVGTGYAFRTVDFTVIHSDQHRSKRRFAYIPDQERFQIQLGVGRDLRRRLPVRTGRVSMLPEVRYTRWGNSDG